MRKLYVALGVTLLVALSVATYVALVDDDGDALITSDLQVTTTVPDHTVTSTGGVYASGDEAVLGEPALTLPSPSDDEGYAATDPDAAGDPDPNQEVAVGDPSSSASSASAAADPASTGSGPAGGSTGTPSGSTGTATGATPGPGAGTPAPSTPTPSPDTPNPGAAVFDPIRNAKAEFSQYANVASADLPMASLTAGGFGSPNPNPISGQFRMHCEYSHFAYDDPIVYPGNPGQSHLHMFFGNTETDAFSNSDSLFDQGGGSCNGYELDRSAYWIPALMNGSTETIVPSEILLYFKTNSPGSVQAFPKGLRVIAGASPDDPDGANRYRWKCEGNGPINFGPFYDYIPDCRAMGYDTLGFMLDFPMCWDGKNLDSADHRSHMSYSCGASHPVVFPQLQYIIHFPAPASTAGVHLASDSLECQTGAINRCGQTLHGDWWNAWHEQTNQTWIAECSRKRVVCQVPSISATTRLVGAPLYTGPTTLQMPSGSYIPGKN